MVVQVPLDFFLLVAAGVSAYYLRFTDWAVRLKPVVFDLTLLEYIRLIVPVAVMWLVIFAFAGLYSTDPNRKLLRELNRVIFACSAGLSAVALYVMFTQEVFDSRFLVAASWAAAVLYVALGRVAMRALKGLLYRVGIGARRVVVIGHHGVAEEITKVLRARRELGYVVVEQYVHFHPDIMHEIEKKRIDEIIFTNPRAHEEETLRAIEFCHDHHITFKYSADLFDTFSANMVVHPLAGVPVVELRRTPLEGWGRVVKRLFDVVLSILVLFLTSPLLIGVALGILCETGRPIWYKNKRVGLHGQHFYAWKFRSMYQADCTGDQFGANGAHAEAKERELIAMLNSRQGPIYKIKDDPRVTPFGRWLRRWSVDELPQFFNVIFGSMSIVGPRPHQPREVDQYAKAERQHVLTIKPGITGLAQVSGRSDLLFEEEIRLDVLYIERWNLWLDLVIFFKTPFILLKKRRAL